MPMCPRWAEGPRPYPSISRKRTGHIPGIFRTSRCPGYTAGSPGLRICWLERNPLRRQKGFPCRTRDRYGSWPPISSACATAGCWGWSIWSWTNRQWFSLFMNWPQGTGTPLYLRGTGLSRQMRGRKGIMYPCIPTPGCLTARWSTGFR